MIVKLGKIKAPPLTLAVVSRFTPGIEIPDWEQRLSSAAVCMTLIIAAQAMGYGANWITDWYAYDVDAGRLLGLGEGERITGFVHLGTSAEPPLERVRPDVDALVTGMERMSVPLLRGRDDDAQHRQGGECVGEFPAGRCWGLRTSPP